MGCGCGRNRNNRRKRVKKIERENLSIRLAAAEKNGTRVAAKKKLMKKKLKFCNICPHSQQTREERRKKTKVCHKINTSIQAILNKKKITCPIGNF